MKVICSKANNPKCPGCSCAEPHEPQERLGESCTQWNVCYNHNGRELFKVRCIDIGSKQGQKILEDKKYLDEFQLVGNIGNSQICIRPSDPEKCLYVFCYDKIYWINQYGNVTDNMHSMVAQTQQQLFEFLYSLID